MLFSKCCTDNYQSTVGRNKDSSRIDCHQMLMNIINLKARWMADTSRSLVNSWQQCCVCHRIHSATGGGSPRRARSHRPKDWTGLMLRCSAVATSSSSSSSSFVNPSDIRRQIRFLCKLYTPCRRCWVFVCREYDHSVLYAVQYPYLIIALFLKELKCIFKI